MIDRWLGARCRNSIAKALESLQSYTKRSVFHYAIKTHLSCSFPVSFTALRILLDPIGLILSSEIAHATVSPMPITRGNCGVTQGSNGRPVIQASRLHVNHCNTEYKSQYNKQKPWQLLLAHLFLSNHAIIYIIGEVLDVSARMLSKVCLLKFTRNLCQPVPFQMRLRWLSLWFLYKWILRTVRCRYNAVIFFKTLIMDTPQIDREGDVWGICCEFEVWFTYVLLLSCEYRI